LLGGRTAFFSNALGCRTLLSSRDYNGNTDVIWIFEREGRRAKLEVLYLAPDKYELRFVDADGVEHVETFTTATDAGNRQLDLEHTLAAQGWEKAAGWKL